MPRHTKSACFVVVWGCGNVFGIEFQTADMDYCVRRFARLRISGVRCTLPVLNLPDPDRDPGIQDMDDLLVDMVPDHCTRQKRQQDAEQADGSHLLK